MNALRSSFATRELAALGATYLCGVGISAIAAAAVWPWRGKGVRLQAVFGESTIAMDLPQLVLVGGGIVAAVLTVALAWRFSAQRWQRSIETALLAAERRWREMFDRATAIVATLATADEGRTFAIRDLNAAALRLSGLAPADAAGSRLEVLLPGLPAEVCAAVGRVWQTGVSERFPPAYLESAKAWIETTLFRLSSGEVVLAASDLTAQKAVEEECRRLRSELAVSLDATGAGSWWWCPDEQRTHLDARCAELCGVEAAGWYDESVLEHRVHPDDLASLQELFRSMVREPREMDVEYRLGRPAGSFRRVCSRVRPVAAGGDDAPLRVVGCTWDVSDRRTMEEDLQRVQRFESIGTLAAGVAHNLNNALAPIAMGLDLLRRHVGTSSVAGEALDAMTLSVRRAGTVVRQLAALTRGAAGRSEPVAPGKVLARLRDMLAPLLPASIECRIDDPPPGMPEMYADEAHLRQALLALATNARDAMPHGGRLTVACCLLEIGAQNQAEYPDVRPGRYVAFVVADTGTGIPAAVRERIFDPFFTTKEAGRGAGLGLPSVLGIVRAHGGGIALQSEEGRGTHFTVLIPAGLPQPVSAPAIPAANVAAASRPPAAGKELCVLVVDDEPAVRDLARRALQMEGFRVLSAGDGKEGLAVFAAQPDKIDAVVIDLVMPMMDGASAAAAMVRLRPDIPVIAASGFAAEDVMEQARRAGVVDFLQKPFSVDQLVGAVRDAAAGKHPANP